MTDSANKELARAYFERVLNLGDISAADTIFARDIRFHYPLGDLSGLDAVKGYIEAVHTAFPDIHFAVADYIGEAGHIAARWSLSGSQTGQFRGNPPTCTRVSLPGITVFDMVDGKIKEMWVAFDPARLIKS